MSAASLYEDDQLSLSSVASSKCTKATSSATVHMGWLQQRVPGLLFTTVWQPRFCVVKQHGGSGMPQLHIYKTNNIVNGTLLSSMSVDRVHCHTYHAPSKLPFVLEITSSAPSKSTAPTTATTLFAIQSVKLFQSWRAHLMSLPGLQVSGTSSSSTSRGGVATAASTATKDRESTPATARAPSALGLVDGNACHKCLETFLSAATVHSTDCGGSPVQRHLQQLLQSKWQADTASVDGNATSWRVNESPIDHLPNRDVLAGASPFGWTWTVVDVFATNATTTTFRWKAEGYFTGRFDHQLGDGQVLEQHGFGRYNAQEHRMDLYYNPDTILNGLEAYATSAKYRLSTFAA